MPTCHSIGKVFEIGGLMSRIPIKNVSDRRGGSSDAILKAGCLSVSMLSQLPQLLLEGYSADEIA